MTSSPPGLSRFHAAQDQPASGYTDALREMRAGAKRSHWIWYVLPQLSGLGLSPMAQSYGIRDGAEADAYLRDPILRGRLLAIVTAIAAHVLPPASTTVASLMGSEIDARKVVSSLTLFEHVSRSMPATERLGEIEAIGDIATRVLDVAESHGYERCAFTLASLEST